MSTCRLTHMTAPGECLLVLNFSSYHNECIMHNKQHYIKSHLFSPFCGPRDVSSAGLVIANHQDIKSEIETRADSFTACIEMGNTLINNNHYAADEVLCNRSCSLFSAVISMHIYKKQPSKKERIHT